MHNEKESKVKNVDLRLKIENSEFEYIFTEHQHNLTWQQKITASSPTNINMLFYTLNYRMIKNFT